MSRPNRPAVALLLLALGSCGGPTLPPDLAMEMGSPDLAAEADLAISRDLAMAADLVSPPDLVVPPDLAMPPDLASPPDLAVPLDLTLPPDFAPPPPDLTPPPDLRMSPTLTSILPASGPSNGGISVTLGGSHFDPAAKVKFGNTDAFNVKVVSPTEITATVPAIPGALGKVPVSVTNPDGFPPATRNDLFSFYYGALSFDAKTLPVGSNPNGITAADFTGDNIQDLVVTNCNSNNYHVFTGKGDGTFTPQKAVLGGTCPFGVAGGNLDRMGTLDLVFANLKDNNVSILAGQGGGLFKLLGNMGSGGTRPQAVATADINNDTFGDVVVANGSGHLAVLYGDGTGSLPKSSTAQIFQGNLVNVAVSQLNSAADNALDIAVLRADTCSVYIYLGDLTMGFPNKVNPFSFPVGKDPSDLIAADWNGDGKTDLAVANSGKYASNCAAPQTDNVGLLLGIGDGGFQAMKTFQARQNPRALAAGDFNLDGKLDLAVANNGSSDISILLGRGDGTFQAPLHFMGGGGGTNRLVVGDWNGDKKPDLATADNGPDPGTMSVFLNTSS